MEQKLTAFELARQTLMQLAKSKTPPTPENFHRVYDEIAGVKSINESSLLNKSLEKVLMGLGKSKPKFVTDAKKIAIALEKKDAKSVEEQLQQLISAGESETDNVNWSTLLRYLLKQLDDKHALVSSAQKKESLNRIIMTFANDPSQLGRKVQTLITSWGDGIEVTQGQSIERDMTELPVYAVTEQYAIEQKIIEVSTKASDEVNIETHPQFTKDGLNQTKLAESWRDLLIYTFNIGILPQFSTTPGAVNRIEALFKHAQESNTVEEVAVFSEALKSMLLRAELLTDNQYRMQESLIKILRLLMTSMGELTVEDQWLHGQMMIVQETISKPLNVDGIQNAENSLQALIQKQSSLKPNLLEAKDTFKSMMKNFVSGLSDITESTGTYNAKICGYQHLITQTEDITQLNTILQNLVSDIGTMSADAEKSHDAFQETQKKVQDAEKQINELTAKLDYISEMAHQDFLTGALNRRGMDEAIEREFNRADRHHVPISIAMLDIDHFKKINDTMGHSTGDVALAHLAKVVKSAIRSTDVLARYGGEEFVILLPGSKQEDAVSVVSGIQRALTKNFFLHNNGSVLITFSAGVAERMTGEAFDSILPRADAALYHAKQNGRNRVVGAASDISLTQQVA